MNVRVREMPETSRRTVLGAGRGLLGLVVVGVDETSADAAAPARPPARRDFTTSLHKVFTTRHGGHLHRLRLTAIQNLPHARAAHRDVCFSLLFKPVGGAVLPDGIYHLKRAGRPAHSLFLVRIGTGTTLQAIVNRAH